MKLYNSEKRENKSISGACVQAKIIRKEDKKIYLRIWNSGTEPAYNVNFYIPKGHRICVLRSRNNCRILEPGRAFDEYAVADEKLSKGILGHTGRMNTAVCIPWNSRRLQKIF